MRRSAISQDVADLPVEARGGLRRSSSAHPHRPWRATYLLHMSSIFRTV
jgi:hypothetical protein